MEAAETPLNHLSTIPLELSVRMPGRHGNRAEGVLVDLSLSGPVPTIRVEFPPPGTPLVAMGTRVPLEIHGTTLSSTLDTAGRAVLWTSSATSFTYGFEIESEFVAKLEGLADRRSTRRVLPPTEAPVDVVLSRPDGPPHGGSLIDVSIGGAGVHVTLEADADLLSAYELHVAIGLPGRAEPLELCGHIRSRALVGELVRIGIQFDPERTRGAELQMGLLETFVASA